MPKNCINCGCAISGEGKNSIFCDKCLSKISPFLKFVSTSKVPAKKLYEANLEKLRGMGLSDAALSYILKCCLRYDEKRALAAPTAVSTVASMSVAPDSPQKSVAEASASTVTGLPADETKNESDSGRFDNDKSEKRLSEYDDEDDDDENEDDDNADNNQRRLIYIILAAVMALLIFFLLYLGDIIPGYSPDYDDTESDPDDIVDTNNDDSSDTDDFIETDDTDGAAGSETESDTVTDEPDDTTETDEPDDTTVLDTDCGHQWLDADCDTPKTCDKCGETDGDALGHAWIDADCDSPKTCERCEKTEGESLDHSWLDADCDSPKTCERCEKTEGESLGHTWHDADCDSPKTCEVCEKTEGEPLGHTWVSTDCETPRTCSVCGTVEAQAAGHTWVDADCENPKTCSVCGAVDGEPLGHTWVDADCENPKTCEICEKTEGEPLGHTSGSAICSECGSYLTSDIYSVGSTATDSSGLEVTLSKVETVVSETETTYFVEYTLTNNTADSITEGSIKLFHKGGSVDPSLYYYDVVSPDGATVTRTVTFVVPSDAESILIEYYDSDALAGTNAPHASGALLWKLS